MRNPLEMVTIMDCWRICRNGRDLQFSDGRRVRFETNLGMRLGTRVFFEEIVSRFHYNSIVGLVYAGAMFVLVSVGLYMVGFELWIPVTGFTLEALFLLLLAIVTAYSPPEETTPSNQGALSDHVLASVNGSVREMTNAVSDLLRLTSQSDIRQDVLLTRLTEYISKSNAETVRSFTSKLDETNRLLRNVLNTEPADREKETLSHDFD